MAERRGARWWGVLRILWALDMALRWLGRWFDLKDTSDLLKWVASALGGSAVISAIAGYLLGIPFGYLALFAVGAMLILLVVIGSIWSILRRRLSGALVTTAPPLAVASLPALREIIGQAYERMTVHLDGVRYTNCTFRDCTLIYNGGLTRATRCRFEGTLRLASSAVAIMNYLTIFRAIYNITEEPRQGLISMGEFTRPGP